MLIIDPPIGPVSAVADIEAWLVELRAMTAESDEDRDLIAWEKERAESFLAEAREYEATKANR